MDSMDKKNIKRQHKVIDILNEKDLDAALVTGWPNIFYLSGLRPIGANTNSWTPFVLVLSKDGEMVFICTRAFSKMMEHEYPTFPTVPFAEDHLIWPFRNIFKAVEEGLMTIDVHSKKSIRLGIEAGRMPVLYQDNLKKLLPNANFLDVGMNISRLRYIKDEYELDEIRKACKITNIVFEEVVNEHLHHGITEYELERALLRTIAIHGAVSSHIQVFSGERSCYQNISPSDRIIKKGDTVLFNYGVRCESGYCSDISRVAVIGEPSKKQLEITEVVKEILLSTLAFIRPGKVVSDIDKHLESKFKELGYAEHYIHRAGHSIGLEPSEGFLIFRDETEILAPGNCLAIEPGIYIDGIGVRLEDDIIVTDDGFEQLTDLPYDMICV